MISGSHNLSSQLGGVNIPRTRCSIPRRSAQDLLTYWSILRHKATLGLCKSVCCLYQMFSIKTSLFVGLVIRATLLSYHVYRVSGLCCATTLRQHARSAKGHEFPRFWILPKFPPTHGHPALRGQLFPKLGAGNLSVVYLKQLHGKNGNAYDHSVLVTMLEVLNMLVILKDLHKTGVYRRDIYQSITLTPKRVAQRQK